MDARIGYDEKVFTPRKTDGTVAPVDLWGKFEPPKLPSGLLPASIATFACVQGGLMGADPGGLAVSALAVCGAAIRDGIRVQVKRNDPNWTESARIWVALIGMPSTKKSPIISEAAKPLKKIDWRLAREYFEKLERYNLLSKEEKSQVQAPKQIRMRIEDTTIEAAQEVLKDSPNGVLCLQDELSGWFGGMDKYSGNRGAAKDRGFWLQSFNGGQYAINRIGRGAGFVENLSISMLGGIQPEAIRKIAAEAVDDGLLQRLFPIVLSPATLGHDRPTPDAVGKYQALVDRLHGLSEEDVGDFGPGASGNGLLLFDDEAQEVRRDLERLHLNLTAVESVNAKLAAHIGKLDGLFARLCVIWHCIEHAPVHRLPNHITAATARRVSDFMRGYLLPHAVSFFAGILGVSPEQDRLAAIAGFILAHRLDHVTFRDIQRGDRAMRGMDRYEAQRALEQLESLGWISEREGPRPSSPSQWTVNPECHRLYAKRAEDEHARRGTAREMISDLLASK